MPHGHSNKPRTDVAVIIVNWNSGVLLRRCLEALEGQTVQPKRMYVVDNASSDASCDGISTDFPDVDLIRLSRNAGFAAGNNVAARRASDCEWIALLNPDAFPEPDWLKALMDAAVKHPEYSFFGSRMLMADNPDQIDGVGDVYHISGLVWREGHGSSATNHFNEEREIFSPCAAAALYQRDIFLEVGGFDEDYFCYVEDVDLGFRLRLRGYRCLYVRNAIVFHKGSAVTGRRSDFSIYHGHRNLTWTFIKNVPPPWLWFLLPLHILACILTIAWFAVRGNGYTISRAKIDAAKGLRRVWAKRRSIQAVRTTGFARLLPFIRLGMPLPLKRSKPHIGGNR